MSKREPRLQFTDAEKADPELEKPIRKVEKAEKKADAAQAKIPKKKVVKKERTVDPASGKTSVRLHFEEVDKAKPPSKLTHSVKDAPANVVLGTAHKEVRENEDDNVGVEASHKLEETAEVSGRVVREGYHSHKLKPYREAAHAEQRLEKANVDALYKKSLQENPELSSNPFSRWQQKQAIKKQYAAAKRTGDTAASAASATQNTAKAAKKTADGTKKVGEFFVRHKKGFGIAIAFLMLLALMLNSLSSCSLMFQGVVSGISSTTYPSEDEDMLGAEAAYAAMEEDLQYELDHYETFHPGYDEYHFELDEIGHDPYVLISILTAYHGGAWTLGEVQGTMQMLFEKQYILTENVEVETRYRTETETGTEWVYDEDLEEWVEEEYEYEVEVPYDYYICTVELENFNLSHLPIYIMGQEQLEMYAGYNATYGNRLDLFPAGEYPGVNNRGDYTDYDIPPEALEDAEFAAMITEAEKYLGYPYVWGGSSPSTSFDCSGFVSWVINHSGWNVGRLGAQGLLNICTRVSSSNARPGDLIFFQGTYDTSGASHVGIYVGNGMMIHCGDPISYANINTSYWQSHFLAFGRLP